MLTDFAKEKVFWTRKMNLKLVKFIESRPSIWNPKHPKYTSVKSRDQTYAEFASKYGNEFTGQAVKDRWTNIRSTYANYLRKLKASRAKADGEEYTINWHLWNACQFLTKVNKKIKNESASQLNIEEIGEQQEININNIQIQQAWSSDEDYHDNSNDPNIKCKVIVDNLIKVFKGMQNDAFGLDNTKHGHVGRTVTKKLSEMNSYEAAVASQKIMDILLLYDESNPQNPNNPI
ncbi:uncharacterized protein LOC131842244 [Achroia grisella]|uniref:uncharacterized protein LOC131842244 n=1 Tax=Achroia grisella TaxID=688607 RepID=UPI0027D2C4FB|nr:uncharacterized protein LOC131842244 [Achroia grisella]